MTRKKTIIETNRRRLEYGIMADEAIIEHPEHGRLYITQGHGGGGIEGQTQRWRHGAVHKLQPGDTLESLRQGLHNDDWTAYGAMLAGYDEDRPGLDWGGQAIEAIALGAGLCPTARRTGR